ncbi:unnamed protein product [Calypogeia fissa]
MVMGKDLNRPLAGAVEALFQSPESIDYAVIDAFVWDNLKGNPAAVVLLSEWKDDKWLQDVAVEFNLSQTAYLVKKEKAIDSKDGSDANGEAEPVIHDFDLRWLTPVSEVKLCGHATMASSHLLYHSGIVGKKDVIHFHTKSGILAVRSVHSKEIGAENDSSEGTKIPKADLVEMSFPLITTTQSVSSIEALPITLRNVGVVTAEKGSNDYLIVELESSAAVENLQPNLQELLNCDYFGLIVTAPGDKASGFDFVSRCFFPKQGINEDPVCGSAHCVLASYWSTKLGKDNLLAYQASKRGGVLELQIDKKAGKVIIRGRSAISMTGVIVQ